MADFLTIWKAIATNIVYLTSIAIKYTCTLDAIGHFTENPAAGQTYVGIYNDNGYTPLGGTLIVEAGPQTHATTYRRWVDTIADTRLTPGLYWLAIVCESASDVLFRQYWTTGTAPNLGMFGGSYYDLGAFTNLTSPCPAITGSDTSPAMFVRVKSIP